MTTAHDEIFAIRDRFDPHASDVDKRQLAIDLVKRSSAVLRTERETTSGWERLYLVEAVCAIIHNRYGLAVTCIDNLFASNVHQAARAEAEHYGVTLDQIDYYISILRH